MGEGTCRSVDEKASSPVFSCSVIAVGASEVGHAHSELQQKEERPQRDEQQRTEEALHALGPRLPTTHTVHTGIHRYRKKDTQHSNTTIKKGMR